MCVILELETGSQNIRVGLYFANYIKILHRAVTVFSQKAPESS